MSLKSEDDRVAIIGYWCRVPGALSPEAFWANLCAGHESISTVSASALADSGVASDTRADPRYVARRGILADADAFDVDLYGVSPAEAELTDPQHRQFLECAWLALSDAGYCPDTGLGRMAVIATQSGNGYREACADWTVRANRKFQADIYCAPGHLASSVAYRFGLEGPALSVQSACSSSLVAVHLACRALQAGDCDAALAGGVSIGWPQHVGHLYVEGGIMSRDGHCRPFDQAASGTVRGEGVGVVVLKRYADAIRDGDTIRAVINGSAINNDGAARAGYSAPSAAGQVRAIREAMARAGVAAGDVGYVEAHGTATLLGDAIELDALRETMPASRTLFLGSVKGNIGHLDAAAGVVGMIKTAMMIERRQLLPTLHHSGFSKALGEPGDIEVVSGVRDWPEGATSAGVSSFGLGGTNAHLVLSAGPAADAQVAQGSELILLSAATETGLADLQSALATAIADKPEFAVRDIAHTLALGRRGMRFRRTIVASSTTDLRARLAEWGTGAVDSRTPLVFSFGGAIDEVGLAEISALYKTDAAFRAQFDRVSDKLLTRHAVDLRQCLAAQQLQDCGALLGACAGYALARRLIGIGIQPDKVRGRGTGAAAAGAVAMAIDIDMFAAILAAYQNPDAAAAAAALQACVESSEPTSPEWIWEDDTSGEPITAEHIAAQRFWTAQLAQLGAGAPLDVAGQGGTLPAHPGMVVTLAGLCWERGAALDWREIAGEGSARRLPLPHPPLVRTRFAPPRAAGPTADLSSIPAVAQGVAASITPPVEDDAAMVLASVRAVLGNEAVMLEDDFFQVGGCSLTVLDLQERLVAQTGREVQLHDLFNAQTLNDMVRAVAGTRADTGSDLERMVTCSVCAVLGLAEAHRSDNFFEIGGCSITALDLHDRLCETSGAALTLHDIFEAPTLAALADRMVQLRTDAAAYGVAGHQPTLSAPTAPIFAADAGVAADASANVTVTTDDGDGPSFSIFFFSGDSASVGSLYDIVMAAAQFGDRNGFEAVWTPERHFHGFGASFPAPALLAAAIAAVTKRINVRAGSIVLPLHDPLRLTEEWAVVDRLSSGRAGLSFAPGFHPTDFVFRPDAYHARRETFWPAVDLVRQLWRGEAYRGKDGAGRDAEVVVQPSPLRPELPCWITASDKAETFIKAGHIGANVLTALMGQTPEQLADNIVAYRRSRAAAGHPDRGQITLMLHSFVHPDPLVVEKVGRAGLRRYLDAHLDFAAMRPDHARARTLDAAGRAVLLDHAVAKYMTGRSLIGTPTECAEHIAAFKAIGVDEIACLVDFGPDQAEILESLGQIARLMSSRDASAHTAAPQTVAIV